jgi:uncharacterized iron-regulated protein
MRVICPRARILSYVVETILAFALSACVAATQEPKLGRNHPLAGRIWDVSAGKFIDAPDLYTNLARADFILLGEQHDNPEHHLLQAKIVERTTALGRRRAVGFEMFSIDQADAIAKYLSRRPTDAAGLGPATSWEKSGWPDWSMYEPIAEAALAAKLPIIATNLPLSVVRRLARGVAELDSATKRQLALDQPMSPALYTLIADDIRASHCGYAPEQSIKAMVDAQRARDAQMAQSLITGATTDGAILIAGAGHARKDYGVPVYLRARGPGKQVVSVAFIEVDNDKPDPLAYRTSGSTGRTPFDYLWFTPRTDDEDPCEKFKAQFENFKKPQ